MVLFIYLKIILIQYFQFSVFNCIQTDPNFTINIANDEEIMRSSNSIREQICNFRRIRI